MTERQCVTHHHACDCRERKFQEMEEINAELLEALNYYLPLLEDCNRRGTEGDLARNELAKDIGKKASEAIAKARRE